MSDGLTVIFAFKIGARVKLTEMGLPGHVISRCDFGHMGNEYKVVYWANSERKETWLPDYELEELSA